MQTSTLQNLTSDISETSTKQDIVNILIVDDRPENLLSLESILENDNRNIYKALSGNEALRIALETDIAVSKTRILKH